MCQRAFASSAGPAKVRVMTAIPTWGATGGGLSAVLTQAQLKKKSEEEEEWE